VKPPRVTHSQIFSPSLSPLFPSSRSRATFCSTSLRSSVVQTTWQPGSSPLLPTQPASPSRSLQSPHLTHRESCFCFTSGETPHREFCRKKHHRGPHLDSRACRILLARVRFSSPITCAKAPAQSARTVCWHPSALSPALCSSFLISTARPSIGSFPSIRPACASFVELLRARRRKSSRKTETRKRTPPNPARAPTLLTHRSFRAHSSCISRICLSTVGNFGWSFIPAFLRGIPAPHRSVPTQCPFSAISFYNSAGTSPCSPLSERNNAVRPLPRN